MKSHTPWIALLSAGLAMKACVDSAQLYSSSCVAVSISNFGSHKRLSILAQPLASVVGRDDVAAVLLETERLFDAKQPFRTFWDLRHCPVPSIAVVCHCVRWALKNKASLDKYNRKLTVLLPENRPTLRYLVSTVLTTFCPVCPTLVSADMDLCESFMDTERPESSEPSEPFESPTPLLTPLQTPPPPPILQAQPNGPRLFVQSRAHSHH